MTDVPLRVKPVLDLSQFKSGIGEMISQSMRAATPMKKAFSGVKKEIDKAGTSAKKLGTEGKKAGDKIKKSMEGGAFAIRGIATEMEGALRGLVIGLTAVTAAGGLLARQALNWSAEFEVLKITFETLTGSVTVADNMIREMKDFAVRTPLQLRDVEEAGTTLLALGEAAQDVIPILSNLGQAAVAMNKPLEQFIRARQLLSQGVVLTRTLAPLGISRDILAQFGAGAAATGAQLVAAFDKALGKFEGLFERTFDTVRGRMSNLKDELAVMFAAIGDPMRDIFISTVDQMRGFLDEVKTFFEENKVIIEHSFQLIKESAENFIKPVFVLFGKFFADLKEHPEKVIRLANTFANLAKVATGLLVFGSVAVGLLKFWAAVTLMRIAMPRLIESLQAMRTLIISTRIAMLSYSVAILAVVGILYLNKRAQDDLSKATEEAQVVYNRAESRMERVNFLMTELGAVLQSAGDETELTTEQMDYFQKRILEINEEFPNMITQLGYVVDAEGDLYTATGDAITGIEDLQRIVNEFNTSSMVAEVGRAAEALMILAEARLMEAEGPEPGARQEDIRRQFEAGEIGQFQAGLLMFMADIGLGIDALSEAMFGTMTAAAAEAAATNEQEWQALLDRLAASPGGIGGVPPGGGGGLGPGGRGRRVEEVDELIELMKKENEARQASQLEWVNIMKESVSAWRAQFTDLLAAVKETYWNYLNQIGIFSATQIEEAGMFRRQFLNLPEDIQIRLLMETDIMEQLGFEGIRDFADNLREIVRLLIGDTEDIVEDLEEVSNEFMTNLSRTIGDFLAQWGARGGAPDARGAGMSLLQPAATQWGIDLAAMWNTGGFMAGPIAGAIMGGAGFIANRLIGEEPLKIEQPVDIRIVDIQTHLKNFFNFRGLDPFTYRSSFQSAFENGEF